MTVPGRGFLMNNEMTDFDFAPATPTTYDPNLPAPGKRPRSSMSPTIVLKNGAPDFAVGSPGGSTIITTVLQILVNHVDFGMTLPQAIAAPRASQRNAATTDAEPAFYNSALRQKLESQYGEAFKEQTGPVLPDRPMDRQRHRHPASARRPLPGRGRTRPPRRRQRPRRQPALSHRVVRPAAARARRRSNRRS